MAPESPLKAALPVLLVLLGSCGGGGQIPQAKPLPSECLARFADERPGQQDPAAHMALCDRIVASHGQLLRAHLDRFIVWRHYGREGEACQHLFALEHTMATLVASPQDQEDFRFSLEAICRSPR